MIQMHLQPKGQQNLVPHQSNISIEFIVLQVVLDLDLHVLALQVEGVGLGGGHVAEGGQFLGRFVGLAGDVVAGGDLQYLIDAGVVVLDGVEGGDGAVEGVEGLDVEHLAHRGLAGSPVRLQVLELGEELEHLLLEDGGVLVEELLEGVGAEVEEHGEVLEQGGVGGFVDVDDVGEHLGQIIVDVVVELPVGLAQEVPVEHELVDVDQQLLADPLQQSLQRVLQVVLAAEGLAHQALDELLDRVELGLQVAGVEPRVGGGVDLQYEVLRLGPGGGFGEGLHAQ